VHFKVTNYCSERTWFYVPPQSCFVRFWLVASVCSYGGLQGAGNRNYCAVATQGVSQRNPCWSGWRPAGGRGQCVYACHRALESSMAQTDAWHRQVLPIISIRLCHVITHFGDKHRVVHFCVVGAYLWTLWVVICCRKVCRFYGTR